LVFSPVLNNITVAIVAYALVIVLYERKSFGQQAFGAASEFADGFLIVFEKGKKVGLFGTIDKHSRVNDNFAFVDGVVEQVFFELEWLYR
jgi:hypothetical protein